MGTLIDSSVLIAAERGRLDLPAQLESLGSDPVAISAITASELLNGVHRATAAHRPNREALVERLLAAVEVLPFDSIAARVHARLAAELYRSPVGAHDLIIAATALALDYRLATRDLRSFPKVRGLRLLRW